MWFHPYTNCLQWWESLMLGASPLWRERWKIREVSFQLLQSLTYLGQIWRLQFSLIPLQVNTQFSLMILVWLSCKSFVINRWSDRHKCVDYWLAFQLKAMFLPLSGDHGENCTRHSPHLSSFHQRKYSTSLHHDIIPQYSDW